MSWNLKTLKAATAYAAFKNVCVEKTGREYTCWGKNDPSVVAVSYNLLDLLNDIDDLAAWNKQRLTSGSQSNRMAIGK